MTPKEYKQMMAYLTRSGIKDKVKFASDVAKPVDKFEVQQIKLFNRFNRDYPNKKADGGRIGFDNGTNPRQGFQPGNRMNLRRRDGNPGNIQALEKITKEKTALKNKKVKKFVELVEKGDSPLDAQKKL